MIMIKKSVNKMKQSAEKAVSAVMICTAVSVLDNIPVSAAPSETTDAVLAPLNNLKTLLTSIVAAIGVIVMVKNIMEISSALQNQDSAGVTSGLKGLAGGAMMAAIGTVLTILGVK